MRAIAAWLIVAKPCRVQPTGHPSEGRRDSTDAAYPFHLSQALTTRSVRYSPLPRYSLKPFAETSLHTMLSRSKRRADDAGSGRQALESQPVLTGPTPSSDAPARSQNA